MGDVTIILTHEEIMQAIGKFAAAKTNQPNGDYKVQLRYQGELPEEMRVTLSEVITIPHSTKGE